MSDRCWWYVQLRSTTVHVELGGEGVQSAGRAGWVFSGVVSRRWKFSRRSFYRGLCGHAEAAIACCRQPSPPVGTPAAPQDPQVPLPQAACWCPELRPTSQIPASGSSPCALCLAPEQKSEKGMLLKRLDHRKCGKSIIFFCLFKTWINSIDLKLSRFSLENSSIQIRNNTLCITSRILNKTFLFKFKFKQCFPPPQNDKNS